MTALCVTELKIMNKIYTPTELSTRKTNKSCKPLHVVHRNKQLPATARTTTIYHLSNDKNDTAPIRDRDASYYLLPDPYADASSQEEYTSIFECGSTDTNIISDLFQMNDTDLKENKSYSGINKGMYKVL